MKKIWLPLLLLLLLIVICTWQKMGTITTGTIDFKSEEQVQALQGVMEEKRKTELEKERLAAETKAKTEAEREKARLTAEAEAKKLAEDKVKQAEEAREAADAKAKAEGKREKARLTAEAEAKRVAEEKAKQEAEAKRLAEAKAEAEKARLVAEVKAKEEAEKARLTAEAKANELALQEAEAEEKEKLLATDSIKFTLAKSTLLPEGERAVDNLGGALKRYPDVTIAIAGHADGDGDSVYNLKLSQKRANTVLNRLRSLGVDEARMRAEGYGETKPLLPNTTRANKQTNRRVEITIKGKQ